MKREKKERTPRSSMTTKRKLEVMVKWGHCYLCLAKLDSLEKTQFDHVIPLELGGTDDIDNIKPAHAECHREKTRTDAKDIAKMRRRIRKEEEHLVRLGRHADGLGNGEPTGKAKRSPKLSTRPFRQKYQPNVRQISDE